MKASPHRLGPPPQLGRSKVPIVHQKMQEKVKPKMKEIVNRHIKILAKYFHLHFSWKKFLMSWMVLVIASKMVFLMLTSQYFTLTSLLSLEIFHGIWTIAFFCLTVINKTTLLPNASCLLAGYLPATTVLHILLIPNDYPLAYIITDAATTLLAIVTMFMLLRIECTQILQETEQIWKQPNPSYPGSDAGTNSTNLSSGTPSPQIGKHVIPPLAEKVSGSLYQVGYPSMEERDTRELNNNNMGCEEVMDLEPIDFEYFFE